MTELDQSKTVLDAGVSQPVGDVEHQTPGLTVEYLAQMSRSPATWRAYHADWKDFVAWCDRHGLHAMPSTPDVVGRYLADLGTRLSVSTIERRLSAIIVHHRRGGYPLNRQDPAIGDVVLGLRRVLGVAHRGKTALLTEDVRGVVTALPTDLAGLRDRALILMMFAGALRRSEASALRRSDIVLSSEGIRLTVRRSKSDQEGRGTRKAIPFGEQVATCPVRTLRSWMIGARLDDGPLFRPIDRHGNVGEGGLSGAAVADIVKRAVRAWARARGLSSAQADAVAAGVGGHSLRAGMATTASRAGVPLHEIAAQTGHASIRSLRPYIREGRRIADSAGGRLGL